MSDNKIEVNYFQRKIRRGFSNSIETIFDNLRDDLSEKIISKIYYCPKLNDGFLSKVFNIFYVLFQRKEGICHIAGEVHFISLLMQKRNVILTVHDCGMLLRKEGISKLIVKWLYLTMPISRSKIITTVSECTKQEIISYTNCDPKRIHVIPVAISSAFKPKPRIFKAEMPNVLQIGTSYNKNIERLIVALNGIACHLTIIGKLTEEQIALLGANCITYSQYSGLSLDEMLLQYEQADIVSFISISEGFGMPIVEANTVERVVITSNLSSMPEVAGNSACFVNPYDIEDIRNGFARIIADEQYRERLIENGRMNRTRFDPSFIANQYYELYASISEKRNS